MRRRPVMTPTSNRRSLARHYRGGSGNDPPRLGRILRRRRPLSCAASWLGAYASLILVVVCSLCCGAVALLPRGEQHDGAGLERLPVDSAVSVTPAFLESSGAGQTWYTMRMNKAPRYLRLTATPDEKETEGKRWYQVLFNFKPSILKLTPDAKT